MCHRVSDVEFKAGDEQHSVEIEVLYDGEREMREAFTVHMKPDDNMVAEIQVTRSRCPVCVRSAAKAHTRERALCQVSPSLNSQAAAGIAVSAPEVHGLIKSFSLRNEMLRGMSQHGQWTRL